MATRVARRLLLTLAIFASARGCAGGGALRGSSLVDRVLEDDPTTNRPFAPKTSPRRRTRRRATTSTAPGRRRGRSARSIHPRRRTPRTTSTSAPAWAAARGVPTRSRLGARQGARIEARASGARQVRLPAGHERRRVRARPTRALRRPRTHRDVPALCYNDCSGRGECVEGFCNASPAFRIRLRRLPRGRRRAQTRPGHPLARSPSHPKVYVYHLPPRFNQHFDSRKLDRPMENIFERISRRIIAPRIPRRGSLPRASRLASSRRAGVRRFTSTRSSTWTTPGPSARVATAGATTCSSSPDWGPCDLFRNSVGPERGGWPDALVNGIVLSHWGLEKRRKEYHGGGPCFIPRRTC